ncbi:MAG: DHH family phosphoesterase, partial [Patescibacteria group bacterium]
MNPDIKTTDKYFQAFDNIQEAQNILLVTHERPDGDGLASVCAMINLLESLNKNYTAFCSDKPGPSFSFLPFIEKIISDKDFFNFKDFDLIIIFDCGGLNRTGLSKEIEGKSSQFIIEFDHHPRMDNYSDLEIRFPKAAAVSEILYYF